MPEIEYPVEVPASVAFQRITVDAFSYACGSELLNEVIVPMIAGPDYVPATPAGIGMIRSHCLEYARRRGWLVAHLEFMCSGGGIYFTELEIVRAAND